MEDTNVGKKIMDSRISKGYSIRELAKLAEVTPSLLSQIERGLSNPSLNTLRAISKSLNMPLFTFFINSVNVEDLVVRSEERKKITFPEYNGLELELLSPNLQGAIEFSLMNLPPSSKSTEKLMEHKGEEAAYVVEGTVKLYLNHEIIELNSRDSVRILPHMKHKWDNPYGKNAIVVFAVTPPSF